MSAADGWSRLAGGAFLSCANWSDKLGKPSEPMPVEEAERRWGGPDRSDGFSVAWLRSGADTSLGVVEVVVGPPDGEFFRVRHLAPWGSLMASFDFSAVGDRLWWEKAMVLRYGDQRYHAQNDFVTSDVTRFHRGSGLVHVRRTDKRTGRVEEEDVRGVDLSAQWSPRPAFGDWADLLRYDRD